MEPRLLRQRAALGVLFVTFAGLHNLQTRRQDRFLDGRFGLRRGDDLGRIGRRFRRWKLEHDNRMMRGRLRLRGCLATTDAIDLSQRL